ncbi:DNA ligase [Streptomyces sp. NPDC057557]|uniref:ATP-dependent DNA ligase n=1 Tax=Streptomyces sp. NPDC057557 TaxID=3346167 RepID=UPI003674BFCA
MEFPIKVALAQVVPILPDGPGWWYEPKFDGHRTVLRRTDDTVFLYARSGRVVTQHWTDLAVAGMELRPGTVLDGEAVIWRDGRLDFAAAQSRSASSVTRARALAARYPASYVCWDVIQHPDPAIGDLRSRPYTERRAYLLELLADLGPPIQPVPATNDREVALHWYEALQAQGIEGIVAKPAGASHRAGRRGWGCRARHRRGSARPRHRRATADGLWPIVRTPAARDRPAGPRWLPLEKHGAEGQPRPGRKHSEHLGDGQRHGRQSPQDLGSVLASVLGLGSARHPDEDVGADPEHDVREAPADDFDGIPAPRERQVLQA